MTDKLHFTLDGKIVAARPAKPSGKWQNAKASTSHICAGSRSPAYRADGNCRACMVEIEGERVLSASCIRKPAPDMVVKTATERAVKARRIVV